MALLLKNVHAVDPQVGLNDTCDILVEDGKIAQVGAGLQVPDGVQADVLDMKGKVALPGLVDIHVHLRDPGQEYKEDIFSGTRAAAHGGFTDVCCMPNTNPVIDTGAVVEYVRSKAAKVGKCRVHVAGACTVGEKGEALAEMGDMVAHGAVMFTDDGRGVQDSGMMRRVMEYALQFGLAVSSHCQDESLVGKGQINEGAVSTRLGLAGWPCAGEEVQIGRDIEIAALTGGHIHVQHLSSAHGLDLVRAGKARGVNVTCEVTPHHMFLTEDSIDEAYDTRFKVNPPLRTQADARAVVEGVVDGTVDCIVTDHAPHAAHEKAREFELAPFGMTGIETSVGLVVSNLVNPGVITWERMVELMSVNPRRIIGVDRVALEPGSRADLTFIDPALEWTVCEDDFESKATNCGFTGWKITGRATDVFVAGEPTMRDCNVL